MQYQGVYQRITARMVKNVVNKTYTADFKVQIIVRANGRSPLLLKNTIQITAKF